MINLIRAELRKLLSTQVWFWMLILSVGVIALVIVTQFLSSSDIETDDVKDIFTVGFAAYIPAFVLGVLGVTTEFRYQTITPTLLATPSRIRLMSAKFLTYVVVGIVLAVISAVTIAVIALPWLAARNVHYSFVGDGVLQRLVEVSTVIGLFALLGLAFGAAVRNQIVAVTVGVVYLLVIENLMPALPGVRRVYPYLPGGAARAIFDPNADVTDTVHTLGTPAGYAVLIAWTLVLSAIGALYSLNRDIT